MEHQSSESTPNLRLPLSSGNRILLKAVIIGLLAVTLLIPIALIHNLVIERAERQQAVSDELSRQWADTQTIKGPVLAIPYYEDQRKEGRQVRQKAMAYFVADQLQVDAAIIPESRNRSVYQVYLMRSDLVIKGRFKAPDLTALRLSDEQMLWSDARLIVGFSDQQGLSAPVSLEWNGHKDLMETGVPANSLCTTGLHAPVHLKEGDNTFQISLKLRSSQQILFNILAAHSRLQLHSTWTSPAFQGMPDTTAVNEQGFYASWQLAQAAKMYPLQWKKNAPDTHNNTVGVGLAHAQDSYTKADRVTKYAILFIVLTFAVFFLIEVLLKIQIHPLQYGLVGVALCVFYTLLLSISEYTGFDTAYLIASAATILLIGMYVWHIFRKPVISFSFMTGLSILYIYIFILIQLEEMALIFGSIALFLVVAAIMFFTRKVNWYGLTRSDDPSAQENL